MKKQIIILTAIAIASLGFPQTPTYLHVPAPRGTKVAAAQFAVAEASLLGYDGVVIPVGTDEIQDPLTTDWSGFAESVDEALRFRLKVHLRLLQNVPVRAFSNGVAIGPSAWVTRYNNGVTWNAPFRPPLSVCPYIAKLVWQRATDIACAECVNAGLNPVNYISEELTNEPCVGGAGGPYAGTSFATGVWPSLPQGTIEPYFWKMLRTLRYSYSSHGIPTYAATLEGTAGTVGQTELNCLAGDDAARVSAGCTGWGFNRYASVPCSSPSLEAASWSNRAQAQITRMRLNPLIASKPLFITEFGMKNSSSLMTGPYSVCEYRRAVLNAERSLPGVIGGGWFLSISTNTLGLGYQLWNSDQSVVDDLVGPNRL